jgi:hypothetical protein
MPVYTVFAKIQLADCNAQQTAGSPIRIRINPENNFSSKRVFCHERFARPVSAGNEKDEGGDVKRDTAARADTQTLTHKDEKREMVLRREEKKVEKAGKRGRRWVDVNAVAAALPKTPCVCVCVRVCVCV